MKKILIVEDDAITAKIYRSTLEKAGFQIDVAANGQAALDRLNEFAPDGLLADLMMPGIGGIELLKRIRAIPQFQKLPVICYTNAFVSKLVDEAKAAGAAHVFNKSTLTPTMLVEAFTTATNGSES